MQLPPHASLHSLCWPTTLKQEWVHVDMHKERGACGAQHMGCGHKGIGGCTAPGGLHRVVQGLMCVAWPRALHGMGACFAWHMHDAAYAVHAVQVRDEFRLDYDPGRGGYGKVLQHEMVSQFGPGG